MNSVSPTTKTGSAGRRVVVLGGTSEIALAIVGELQRQHPREVALVGRDEHALQAAAGELTRAGAARAISFTVDARDTGQHESVVTRAFEALGGADIVIVAVGVLGARGGLPDDPAAALDVLQVNVVGTGSLLVAAARALREQGSGTIVVLSSVAAERPRASNVVYGASKAALDALAQGLADDLRADGVRMLVVRPGFVSTRMTRGLSPAPFSTDPQAVARVVIRGLEQGRSTVWAPPVLRLVMGALGLLPRPLFRRLPL